MYFCADLESDSKFAYFYTTRMITRKIEQTLRDLIPYFKVITITGPRQSGKTTLCKQVFPDYAYVNLEDIAVREQAATDPKAFLSAYTQGVIIDEAQNYPELFSYIVAPSTFTTSLSIWVNLTCLKSATTSGVM